jgi:hypothetical protein
MVKPFSRPEVVDHGPESIPRRVGPIPAVEHEGGVGQSCDREAVPVGEDLIVETRGRAAETGPEEDLAGLGELLFVSCDEGSLLGQTIVVRPSQLPSGVTS